MSDVSYHTFPTDETFKGSFYNLKSLQQEIRLTDGGDRREVLGHEPSFYSELPLTLSHSSQKMDSAIATSGITQLPITHRIVAILHQNASRRSASWSGRALLAVTFLTMTVGVSAIRPSRLIGTETNDTPNSLAEFKSNEIGDRKVSPMDWPQWGGSSSRNNSSLGQRIPTFWDIQKGQNVRWSVPLGSVTYGSPIVANGRVFIGTNNGHGYIDRFPKETDLGVLLCFEENSGEFLWQHSNRKLPTGRVNDYPSCGICSTPLVDGDRLWYVSNRGQVVCLDTEGFRDQENDGPYTLEEEFGEREADVVWLVDMMELLDVNQREIANCSITATGDWLFVCTSHGVDVNRGVIRSESPSFLCLNRVNGDVIWSDNSPGENILDGQWSSPAYAVLGGVPQVLFGGGDGYIYGFDAAGDRGKSKLLWKFDCNPKESRYALNKGTRNYIVATPVIYDGLVYVAVGQSPEHGEGNGHLWCIDPNKRGDVSPALVYNARQADQPIAHKRLQALEESQGDIESINPNSAAIWRYIGNNTMQFEKTMHRSCGSVAIHDDLLFIADLSGVFHCLDAKSGKAHWTYDLLAGSWSTPLIVDGRVYISNEDGEVAIFRQSDQLDLIAEIPHGSSIFATPSVANDTLFIASQDRLYAIQEGKEIRPLK